MPIPTSRAALALLALMASLPLALASPRTAPAQGFPEVGPPLIVPGPDYGPPVGATAAPLGLVIQGGASLGAFEAGALQYLTAVVEENAWLVTPRAITGTSAGSINGFLAALALCGHRTEDPRTSVFWNTWIPVGLAGLFDPERVTASAVLTRDLAMADAASFIGARFAEGLSERCDLVFGVPVTRVDPRKVVLDAEGSVPISRVEERFTLRIRGRGLGKAPSVTNHVDPDAPDQHVALATDARGEVPFTNLMALVHASSGIPGAFAPVTIPHCLVGQGRVRSKKAPSGAKKAGFGPVVCTADDADTAEVVDGGFLDNQPLRLATRILVRGIDDGGALRDRPDLRRAALPEHAAFIAVDPTSMTWAPDPTPPSRRDASLASTLGRLLPGLLDAARTSELQAVLEEHPEVRARLAAMQSDWPTASGVLGAFMGIVEADLRVFDFYLGMHEARRIVQDLVVPWASARGGVLRLPDPGDRAPTGVREGWRPLRCLTAMLAPSPALREAEVACTGDGLANLRAVLQATLDRLYARCRALDADIAALLPLSRLTPARQHCVAAYAGNPAPKVPGLPEQMAPAPEGDPDSVAFLFSRLSAAGFDYRDLGVGKASARDARARLARRIGAIARALAAAQPEDTTLYLTGARMLKHGIAWSPPAHALHALGGATWELGWSVTDDEGSLSALRFATALQLVGLSTLVDGEARAWFGLTPLMGIEWEPEGISSALFQLRMGVRGGFRFASGDGFTQDVANADPELPRSRPVVEFHTALVALQWLRLQLGATWLPAFDGASGGVTLKAMLGVELDLPL